MCEKHKVNKNYETKRVSCNQDRKYKFRDG